MRVLVIDDEPDVLMVCRVNLDLAGHEVLEASTGEEGLALARAERPDAIVLDLMLPARDGFQVMAEMATEDELRAIPVILLTARTRAEDRRAGWRAGCTDFITKPFSPLELVRSVARVHEMTSEQRFERCRLELAQLGG